MMANCLECGKEFKANKPWHSFCRDQCRWDWNNRLRKQGRHEGCAKPDQRNTLKLDLVGLGLAEPKPTITRRV